MRDGKGGRSETFDLGLPILCAMSRWKIERRGPGCHECDRPFEDGERHACSLTLVPFAETEEGIAQAESAAQAEAKGAQPKAKGKAAKANPAPESPDPDDEILVRRDLCSGCWQGDEAPEREADLFWWFTRHQEKVSRSVSLDLDSLEQLFLQLEGKGERPVRELRYVLCLLLMRKRRIKVERVLRDEAGESFLVKRPRRDERYKVFVYDFDAERMAEIRDELQAIFDGAEAHGVSLADAGDSSDEDEAEVGRAASGVHDDAESDGAPGAESDAEAGAEDASAELTSAES